MNFAKIQLSAEELRLLQDGSWILTKNVIIQKLYDLFALVAEETQILVKNSTLPAELTKASAKISRGERYNGLPYVMLDYPRFFSKTDVFAIRVFFWWAHYISITLHLKGIYQEMFHAAVRHNLPLLKKYDFLISISGNEWQHDISGGDYAALHAIEEQGLQGILQQGPFVKLTATLPLEKWNRAPDWLVQHYGVLFKTLEY